MRRPLTRAALIVAAACGLLGLAGAAPATASPKPAPTDHVVVVGIAGLRWSDVSATQTPTLAGIVRKGSAGTLSVRAAPPVTCPGEGWLTLGAGTYAALSDPADIDSSRGCGSRRPPPVQRDGAGARIPALAAVRQLNDTLRFGAEPGVLGSSVRCAAASGPGAALAVADRDGRIAGYAPRLPDDPGGLLSRCPLAAVDLGSLPAGSADRAGALRDFDAALATVEQHRPHGSVLMVVGLAEADARQPRLHVAAIEGPGFNGGWLRSSSTRRTPYLQLSDLAPTVMERLGLDVPDEMAGRPVAGEAPGRPHSLRGTIDALADTDTAAVAQRGVNGGFYAGLGVMSLLVYGGLTWLLWRRRRGEPVDPGLLRGLGVAALGLAALPGATFAANLVPWWRAGSPLLALTGAVLAAIALTVGIGYAGPWRRRITGPVAAVAAVTVLITAVDAVTGTPLQINSMLGYNPLVAGRFIGFGNIAFAAFGAAAMLLAAFLAYGRSRLAALGIVAAIAVPMTALDGAPSWGADFGGVLTFVPAFVILALLVARYRVSVVKALLAVAGGVLVVALIGVVDYLRPPDDRSHFGRFVASVLDGSAGSTIYRKLSTSVDLLFAGPHTVAGMVLVVLLCVLVYRPTETLHEVYDAVPSLKLALSSVVVLSAIGFATNDSGVAVPVVAGMVTVPAAYAICARVAARRAPSPAPPGTDTPVPEASDRVEVLP